MSDIRTRAARPDLFALDFTVACTDVQELSGFTSSILDSGNRLPVPGGMLMVRTPEDASSFVLGRRYRIHITEIAQGPDAVRPAAGTESVSGAA